MVNFANQMLLSYLFQCLITCIRNTQMTKIFTCATGDSQSIKDEKGVLPDEKVKSPNNNTMEVCTLV